MNTALLLWAYLSVGKALGIAQTIAAAITIVATLGGPIAFAEDGVDKVLPWLKSHKRTVRLAVGFVIGTLVMTSIYPDRDDVKWILGGAAAVANT